MWMFGFFTVSWRYSTIDQCFGERFSSDIVVSAFVIDSCRNRGTCDGTPAGMPDTGSRHRILGAWELEGW
jgi:hypothetical protein